MTSSLSLSVSSAGSAWAAQIKTIEDAALASEKSFVSGAMGNTNTSGVTGTGNLFSALSTGAASSPNAAAPDAHQGITSTPGTPSSATTWQSIISAIESGGTSSVGYSSNTNVSTSASTDAQIGNLFNLLA
jgi:hypothetical protein